jgi:hypothetical protein
MLADIFYQLGREETLRAVKLWSETNCLESIGSVDLRLVKQVFGCKVSPKVQIVTSENMNLIAAKSSEFRKRVRGVAIGRLG